MNAVKRFFLLNTVTVFIALLVTALAVIVFIAVYTNIIDREAGITGIGKVLETRACFGEIRKSIELGQLNIFTDKESLKKLVEKVKVLGIDALILRNKEVLFQTQNLQKIEIEEWLTLTKGLPTDNTLKIGEKSYVFERMDVSLDKNEIGTILLTAPVQLNGNFYLTLVLFTSLFFIVIFLIMNLWVSITFSKKMITPVLRLNRAAIQMSQGELETEIVEEGEGEVLELSKTLEKMRIKMKEAVYLQQKYDENRKFLISSISHDLKTPVTSIKGHIEGILDGVAKASGKEEEYLNIALSKALQMNFLIDDLLLYSRLDLNQVPFYFERTEIQSFFDYCVADYIHEFEKDNFRITLKSEMAGVVHVLMDIDKFKRVIQNILENAKKYRSGKMSEVVIFLRETRTSVIVEIKDNGLGISEVEVPRIFDRFYRSDAARKSDNGSGLGLAICKHIVEAHDGKIWAISKGDEGTSILISLNKEVSRG